MVLELIKDKVISQKFTKVLDNEDLDILYYPELKLLHYVWKQRALGDAYRNPFLVGIEFAKTHECPYFLSDICNQGVVGPDDRKWFQEVALPGAVGQGLKRGAVIFDGNTFKKYYLNIILQHVVKSGVPMKFFNDKQEAMEWLVK